MPKILISGVDVKEDCKELKNTCNSDETRGTVIAPLWRENSATFEVIIQKIRPNKVTCSCVFFGGSTSKSPLEAISQLKATVSQVCLVTKWSKGQVYIKLWLVSVNGARRERNCGLQRTSSVGYRRRKPEVKPVHSISIQSILDHRIYY